MNYVEKDNPSIVRPKKREMEKRKGKKEGRRGKEGGNEKERETLAMNW